MEYHECTTYQGALVPNDENALMDKCYRLLGINMDSWDSVYCVKDHQTAFGLDNYHCLLGYHSASVEHLRKLQKHKFPGNQIIASWISTYETTDVF